MAGAKKVVDTDIQTSTKTVPGADGTMVDIITTKITEKYEDGTTGTRTGTQQVLHTPGGPKAEASKPAVINAALTPATSTAPKADNLTDKDFINACLAMHNKLRAKHGAPALTLDDELGKIAAAWAKELTKMPGQLKHNKTGFGECVYWNTDVPEGGRPVQAWYSEQNFFDWKRLEGQKGTGHFTQLIWKNTKQVGIAMAIGKHGHFVVCNYFPPGNVVGKFPDNIQKAK